MDILIEPSEDRFLNTGDSAMMQVAIKRLCAMWPDARIYVLTNYPDLLPRYSSQVLPISNAGRSLWIAEDLMHLPAWRRSLYLEHPSISSVLRRLRYRSHVPEDQQSVEAFLRMMRRVSGFVVAGMGGLTCAFPGYAAMVLDTLSLARECGVPTFLLGQGLGPFDSELEEHARRVLRGVDYIALREGRHGPALLRKWGLRREQWTVTGDDAIELALQNRADSLGQAIGFNIRVSEYSGVSNDLATDLRGPLQDIGAALNAPFQIIAISRVPEEDDASRAQALITGYPAQSQQKTPDELMRVIREIQHCRIVITGSYHAGVFALAQGIPVVGLYANDYYQWKFEGLAHQFGDGCCILRLGRSDFSCELQRIVRHSWSNASCLRTELLECAVRQQQAGTAAYAHVSSLLRHPLSDGDQCLSQ
jgi:colanic acid/amylovoran biosynthesis protein